MSHTPCFSLESASVNNSTESQKRLNQRRPFTRYRHPTQRSAYNIFLAILLVPSTVNLWKRPVFLDMVCTVHWKRWLFSWKVGFYGPKKWTLSWPFQLPFLLLEFRLWKSMKFRPPPPHFRGDEDSICDYPMLFLNIKMWIFAFSVPTLCFCQRKDVNVNKIDTAGRKCIKSYSSACDPIAALAALFLRAAHFLPL